MFALTPQGSNYAESILYTFGTSDSGLHPAGDLIADATGALYGVTSSGGKYNDGTAFKLTPKGPTIAPASYTRSVTATIIVRRGAHSRTAL